MYLMNKYLYNFKCYTSYYINYNNIILENFQIIIHLAIE